MSFTEVRGNEQILDKSITREKLVDDFVDNATWNISSTNTATITGLQLPVNPNDAADKEYVDQEISSATPGVDDITVEVDSTNNKLTIKEINYIIDDDNQSIDGSDTPMSDAHHELVTRAKVEQVVSTLSPWQVENADIDGDGTDDEKIIYPSDPLVKEVSIKENTRGFTGFYVENSGNESNNDNYSGSNIVLTTSSASFDSQTYIAHHGSKYYDAYLRNRGAIMTDSSMIIGAYNSTDKQNAPAFVSFVVGDDYQHQKEIFKLTTNGLEMTLSDKKFWYEAGKTPEADPANYTQLRCNTDTGEVYATAAPIAPVKTTERFDISNADVANGYIDLANTVRTDEHLFAILNGIILDEDSSGDFTTSTNRLTFSDGVLTDGDKLIVKYSY